MEPIYSVKGGSQQEQNTLKKIRRRPSIIQGPPGVEKNLRGGGRMNYCIKKKKQKLCLVNGRLNKDASGANTRHIKKRVGREKKDCRPMRKGLQRQSENNWDARCETKAPMTKKKLRNGETREMEEDQKKKSKLWKKTCKGKQISDQNRIAKDRSIKKKPKRGQKEETHC